jgi:RES domain-containing protein
MIGVTALGALIAQYPSRPLRDTYFRAMALRHHGDPLGRKRPIARQRFNVAGGARVLYVGDDQITCLFEVQAFGFPVTSIAIVPVQFQLNAVLDLRDAALLNALAITPADVAFNFRSLPHGSGPSDMQRLGEAISVSKQVDGLLYESLARPGSTCLAVFEADAVSLGGVVAVNDAQNGLVDRLP